MKKIFAFFERLGGLLFQKQEEKPCQTEKNILAAEKSLFHHFHSMPVEELMVPRADMVAVADNTPFQALVALFLEKNLLGVPVFQENLDNLVGFIYVGDALEILAQQVFKTDLSYDFAWTHKIRPILFVPAAMTVPEAWACFQETKSSVLAIVDEYGGVDGLLFFQDVAEAAGRALRVWENSEEIFFQTVQRKDGAYLVDGRLNLKVFEEEFGPFLSAIEKSGDIETIGGLVCSLSGRVPLRGEVIAHASGLEFEILEADPRRVKHVAVRFPEKQEENLSR